MHILMLCPAFPPFPGGGERYAYSLASALVQQGQQVTVVTSQARFERDLWLGSQEQNLTEEDNEGLHIIRCPVRPFGQQQME